MKYSVILFLMIPCLQAVYAQQKTISGDKTWKQQHAVLKNSAEAELIFRIGDIDNLNFGWEEGFDPFCNRTTVAHAYPWDADPTDLPGFDRILLSSKFQKGKPTACAGDGYSDAWNVNTSKPVVYKIACKEIKSVEVRDMFIQLFIDDFQAKTMCSKFQFTINGMRFAEAEKLFSQVDQTGPVGKLVTIPIPEEFYEGIIKDEKLEMYIDETTGAADGFAVDFIRLLVNRKRENTCKGTIKGRVLDKITFQPLPDAVVLVAGQDPVKTAADGSFSFEGIPTGYEIVSASFPGYNDGSSAADIGEGDENPEVIIELEKSKLVSFDNRTIKAGEHILLKNILFDQGKAILKTESFPELDKVVALLKANPAAEIELGGHTSSEGELAMNRSLSYRRVNACKEYIVSKGIDPGRIIAKGYGPDRPVAVNDTETNRAKNRRVEMIITKI